jgi:phosphate transport system substrate-binding protein
MRRSACLAVCLLALAGCKKSEQQGPVVTGKGDAAGRTIELDGAGATFPYPLYSKWVAEYEKVNPKVKIDYQSIGSGAGIRQIMERTVDFGASDAPLTDEQLRKAPGTLVHLPTTLGAVVVTYNLPGSPKLKLTDDILAGMFLGEIRTWNDSRIATLNAGVKLPDTAISIIHRSDGSGTSAVFTDYLSKVSPAWKQTVGSGTSVEWPVGLGAKGNEGVAGQVKSTPGAVGYVELVYAMQTDQPFAALRNRAGAFVDASLDSISQAAAGAAIPDDYRVSITDAAGAGAYPIASFTYLLVYRDMPDATRGKALAGFIWWALHDGQAFANPLHYGQLPAGIVTREEATLRSLTAGGKPLLAGM